MGRAFLLGVLAAIVAAAVVAAIVIASGVVDVAATNVHGLQDSILLYASTRSIAHHARDEKNPLAGDPAALKKGLEHYREMCLECHGGPGAEPEEFAAGLHPAPPNLAHPAVQAAFTDGMLYEAVARGIGSTGMPAFGKTHPPEEIWSIVAFVRHLPKLTPEEREALARKEPGESHGELPAQPSAASPPGGAGATASAAPGAAGERVHQVSISDFKFDPPTLEVHAGDTIEWKNADLVAHTATADDKTFDTGAIQADQTKRVVVTKKGRFPYFCRYHSTMKGTLVVE